MNILNKDKITILLETGEYVIIDLYHPAKFYINGQEVNELTLRNLQVSIKQGLIPHNVLTITDEFGRCIEFNKNGRPTEKIYGYDFHANSVLKILK